MNPRVLLLDEPLGALDLKVRKELQIELKRIQEEVGITFVYVTHDQEEALAMSDRVVVMNGGRIEQIGVPREIYDRPATEWIAGIHRRHELHSRERKEVAVRPERLRVVVGGTGVGGTVVDDDGHRAGRAVRGASRRRAGGAGATTAVRAGRRDRGARGRRARPVSWADEEALDFDEGGNE